MHAVDHLVEQLWRPALERSTDLRVAVDPRRTPEWLPLERYWLVPRASTARLLVPTGPARVSRRTLTNYRHLRPRATNVTRAILGAGATLRLPLSGSVLEVQVRRGAAQGTTDLLPLPQLARALGRPLFASAGIRTSDNRKTTLHLVDRSGSPVGYAKVGWNGPTDELVATEADVLREVGGRAGPMRAPALLARLDHHGHPVAVTEPLPLDVRGSLGRVPAPTPQELAGLTPVVRRAPVHETGQFRELHARLLRAAEAPHVAELAGRALETAAALADDAGTVPVTSLWHGDLAPWNCARDRSGQLWAWDWENAERDATAGLDALHWTFSVQRLHATDVNRMSLTASRAAAEPYLTALGLAPRDRRRVAALYAVVVVERACSLARHAGGWADALIAPEGLHRLLHQAEAELGRTRGERPGYRHDQSRDRPR